MNRLAGVLFAACLLISEHAVAQQSSLYAPPQGSDGHPDFQGVWESRWMTPMERPPQTPSLVLAPQQAAGMAAAMTAGRHAAPGNTNPDSDFDLVSLARVRGEYRSSLIVDPADGKLPYTAKGRAELAAFLKDGSDDPEQRGISERCLGGPGRVPLIPVPANGYLQIIQPPGKIVLHTESLDDLRILTLGRSHGPAAITDFIGDSTARWEDSSLVVETTNFRKDDGL
ncbi:MAG TPA: hypothetical protein VG942_04605, partial [Hyphomonadaceae bacterium]|nr:hypothetical protein [Hyphomonadaceae bacterium]